MQNIFSQDPLRVSYRQRNPLYIMDPTSSQQIQLMIILQDLFFILVVLVVNKVGIRGTRYLISKTGISIATIPYIGGLSKKRSMVTFRNEGGIIEVDASCELVTSKYLEVLKFLKMDYDQVANHFRLIILRDELKIHISTTMIVGYKDEIDKLFNAFASGYYWLKEHYNIYNRKYLETDDILIINDYHLALVRIHNTGYDIISGNILELSFNALLMEFKLSLVDHQETVLLYKFPYLDLKPYFTLPVISETMVLSY